MKGNKFTAQQIAEAIVEKNELNIPISKYSTHPFYGIRDERGWLTRYPYPKEDKIYFANPTAVAIYAQWGGQFDSMGHYGMCPYVYDTYETAIKEMWGREAIIRHPSHVLTEEDIHYLKLSGRFNTYSQELLSPLFAHPKGILSIPLNISLEEIRMTVKGISRRETLLAVGGQWDKSVVSLGYMKLSKYVEVLASTLTAEDVVPFAKFVSMCLSETGCYDAYYAIKFKEHLPLGSKKIAVIAAHIYNLKEGRDASREEVITSLIEYAPAILRDSFIKAFQKGKQGAKRNSLLERARHSWKSIFQRKAEAFLSEDKRTLNLPYTLAGKEALLCDQITRYREEEESTSLVVEAYQMVYRGTTTAGQCTEMCDSTGAVFIIVVSGDYRSHKIVPTKLVGNYRVGAVNGVWFAWDAASSFYTHREGKSLKDAIANLERYRGFLSDKLNVSLRDVKEFKGFCFAGTRQFLYDRTRHIYNLVERYSSWEDVPADIMDIRWSLSAPDIYKGYAQM
jgi:hypothetical protein